MGVDFPEEKLWSVASKYSEWNGDVYFILCAKFEPEAYSKVKTAEHGMGIHAHCRMHRGFAVTRGYGTATRSPQLRMPRPPNHKWQIANSIDTWMKHMRMLEAMGEPYRLPPPMFKLEAVRNMMTGQRAKIVFEPIERNNRMHSIPEGER